MSLVDPRVLLGAVVGTYLGLRVLEMLLSRNHTQKIRARGAQPVRPDGFWPLVGVQVLWFCGLVAEGVVLPGTGTRTWAGTLPFLALAAAAVGLRHWAIAALGDRWTVRVFVLAAEPLVHRGPYRWLRHPNYLAVFIEHFAAPLALGLWWTALGTTFLSGLGLLARIRYEGRALRPQRVA